MLIRTKPYVENLFNKLSYDKYKETSASYTDFANDFFERVKRPNNLQFEQAVKKSLEKIPYGKYALIFVDDRDVPGHVCDQIKDLFHSRKEPLHCLGLLLKDL